MKPGYKHSEAGVIPEDWEVSQLGKKVTFKTGPFGSALHQSDYVYGGVPVINPMQIVDGTIVPTPSMAVTEPAARKLSDFRLSAGNVIIGRRGEMGRCAFVMTEQDGWLCGTGCMIIHTGPSLDGRYIQRVLSSPTVVAAIENGSVGSTMNNLNQDTLGKLLVPLPPNKDEQEIIAGALCDADALIGALDRLIAKKRDLKQGAMQQLLTGKTRLPGFSGEWEDVTLGRLGSFFKGKGITREDMVEYGLPCIRYGEIYTRHKDYVREFYSFVRPEVARDSQQLHTGDLLFTGSGETAEEIGKCVAFLGNEDAFAGGDIVIFSPVGQDSMFLGYLMNYATIAEQKSRMGQGDAVVHISARSLGSLRFKRPNLPEQKAIASILSDMDAEIAVLEQRRDKTSDLKQGMMQELLTGRTRLISGPRADR